MNQPSRPKANRKPTSADEVKSPKELTVEQTYKRVDARQTLQGHVYFKHGLIVSNGMKAPFRPFLSSSLLFSISDYRVGFLKKGSGRAVINLQECLIEAGTIVFITPGSIIEPLWMSEDCEMSGMGLSAERFRLAHHDELPMIFRGMKKDGRLRIGADEQELVGILFDTLWQLTRDGRTSDHTVNCAIAAVSSYYDNLFQHHKENTPDGSCSAGIFDRFIEQVKQHCHEQHRLAFYADKLCLTERYLGTVIRQTSGVTAKGWIDRALVASAKVMLRHRSLPIGVIADELHFPNASFFCKFFKHHTGLTPQSYRQGKDK